MLPNKPQELTSREERSRTRKPLAARLAAQGPSRWAVLRPIKASWMSESRTTLRASAPLALLCMLSALSSCTATQRQRAAEIALFPVNVVPDILSNTLVILTIPVWVPFSDRESNLWPVIWLSTPILGPACGVMDAWHGYPFWDPVFLDEHRSYEPSAPPTADRQDGSGE